MLTVAVTVIATLPLPLPFLKAFKTLRERPGPLLFFEATSTLKIKEITKQGNCEVLRDALNIYVYQINALQHTCTQYMQ